MRRLGRFHFEGEHNFWNPSSRTELAWYYSSSVSYLFANTVHSAQVIEFDSLAWKEHEPVLDYSGGVGNNIIHLAKKGVRTHYFGIGVMEYRFAQYRIQKLGLEHMVTFKQSFCSDTEYKFDPITDPRLAMNHLVPFWPLTSLSMFQTTTWLFRLWLNQLKLAGSSSKVVRSRTK